MATWNDLMRSELRELRIGGGIVFGSGMELALNGDRVASLAIEEGVDGALMPGDVLSASCTLDLVNDSGQWLEGGSLLGGQQLIGATLMPKLGAVDGKNVLWHPLGVYQVESAVVLEGQGIVRIQAADSIAFELADAFEDSGPYPATVAEIWRRIVSSTRYAWDEVVPNGSAVVDANPGWSGVSIRTAMGIAAAAMGCFVRVDRSGSLELCRVWDSGARTRNLDPACYMKLERDSAKFGPVDALKLTPEGEDAQMITFYTDDDHAGTYALEISGNPLFQKDGEHMPGLAQGTADLLAGYGGTSLRFDWRGDPGFTIGDVAAVTDTAGKMVQGVLTRQSMKYAKGFSASCVCAVPEADSGVRRAITPEGGLNAEALVGAVDGALIRAGSITTNKLAAGSITAEKLAAGAVDAGSITAITAKLKEIASGRLTTDELYAAFADVAVLSAGTADFDFATVQHLVAQALNLNQGVGNMVFIRNLIVDFAQMVSAQIGNLCIKASDGNYYTIDVDAEGRVTAAKTTVSGGEISAGQTEEGRVILETNIVASRLSTSNLLATYALVNEIDAARIDVDQLFAREAFITKLTTGLIVGGKSLNMIAGEVTNAHHKIDTLQIGGVNLFTRTAVFGGSVGDDWNYALPYWQDAGETYQGLVVRKKNTPWDGLSQPVQVKAGEEYTLSAWVKRSAGARIVFYCENTNRNDTSVNDATGTDWRRIHMVFSRYEDGEILPRFENTASGETMYICGLKLERGNKPTDWSAAPEDTREEIDFATPYDSEESPEAIPAVGKIWVDRGVTPAVFRRWKGGTDTTERDGGGWETMNSVDDIRTLQTLLQVQQQNAQAEIDALRTAVVNDNEGVHVRKVDNDNMQLIQNEVLITQKDVNIVSGGVRNSTFGSGYVRLLDMIIRVAGGGLVIEAAEV